MPIFDEIGLLVSAKKTLNSRQIFSTKSLLSVLGIRLRFLFSRTNKILLFNECFVPNVVKIGPVLTLENNRWPDRRLERLM